MADIAKNDLVAPGRFVVGCNYWASHAGTRMWADWRPGVVRQDLRRLRGLQVLRVFPLWPDFQPITMLRTPWERMEVRNGEEVFPDDACGRAGISPVMMERFGDFLDMMARQKLRAAVALVTGWMSGRLFVPPALDGLDVLTDPLALRWQVRFVRHFVSTFKNHPAVLAWELGNECNCMGRATRDQAYAWTALMTQTIRAADDSHPIGSAMHSLRPDGEWTMADQGELTDVLATHPYPAFTPHCDQDPINTIRPILHGTAESRFYSDLGGKPCICEELGTLGPIFANEKTKADYVRSALFSLWAHDCHGLLWWCAADQAHLEHAPYDWITVERELGLLDGSGKAKPVMGELLAFRKMVDRIGVLPARSREAVCIVSDGQDCWGVAYGAFILAKQAGFDLEFQHATQPLKDAPFYLLPCLSGLRMISRHRRMALLEKVRAGATLYVSLNDGLPDGFEPLTGLEPLSRQKMGGPAGEITFTGVEGVGTLELRAPYRVNFRATRATVLGREADGNPAFSVAAYGKGRVYFLAGPIELTLTQTPGAFHAEGAGAWWRVYQHMARTHMGGRAVGKTHPLVGVTEHRRDASHRVVVVINQGPAAVKERLVLAAGWRLEKVLHGRVKMQGGEMVADLRGNDGCVVGLSRR